MRQVSPVNVLHCGDDRKGNDVGHGESTPSQILGILQPTVCENQMSSRAILQPSQSLITRWDLCHSHEEGGRTRGDDVGRKRHHPLESSSPGCRVGGKQAAAFARDVKDDSCRLGDDECRREPMIDHGWDATGGVQSQVTKLRAGDEDQPRSDDKRAPLLQARLRLASRCRSERHRGQSTWNRQLLGLKATLLSAVSIVEDMWRSRAVSAKRRTQGLSFVISSGGQIADSRRTHHRTLP